MTVLVGVEEREERQLKHWKIQKQTRKLSSQKKARTRRKKKKSGGNQDGEFEKEWAPQVKQRDKQQKG